MLSFYDHGKKSGAKSETFNFDIVNKDVSHILIDYTATGATTTDFNLRVEAYLRNGNDKVVIENYPGSVLREFMDYSSGAYAVSATNLKLNIPIGVFHLQDMEKLSCTITDTSVGTVTAVDVQVVSVLLDENTDRAYLYRKSKSDINTLPDCNALILDATNMQATDEIDFRLNGRGGVATLSGLKTLKNFMLYDLQAPGNYVPMLFSDRFEPTTIHYEMKHSNDFTVYYRQLEAEVKRVAASQRAIVRRAKNIVTEIAEKRPESYKGFVSAGVMPPVYVLNDTEKKLSVA